MNRELDNAVKCIREYCSKQELCEGCHFFIEEKDACFFSFSDLPCDWELGGAE